MHVLMICRHHPGQDDRRDIHRPAHREWVRSGGEGLATVLIGSALLDGEGRPAGNFGILEAADLAAARAFAEGDPFARAGLVAGIDLLPLPDGFQADRIARPMTEARG